MTAPSTRPVVHREITVSTTVDRAYALFTQHFDAVKPRHHNLLAAPIVASVLEAEVGGRVYDRADDGTECTWGRGLEVEPGRTRVEIEHRHLDRHGPGWDGLRASLHGDEGWPLYLQRYGALTTSV